MDSSLTADRIAPAEQNLAGISYFASGRIQPRKVAVARGIEHRPDVFPADLLTSESSAAGPLKRVGKLADEKSIADDAGAHQTLAGNLPAEEFDAPSPRGWWLAHTLPRQEKALAAALYAREVPFYLPLITRKSLSRGRTRVARIALFPGYVFICGNEEERINVLKTNRVLTVRQAADGERLRADLQRFYRLIEAGAPLLPEARLIVGERVRVKAGPFRDQEGIVIRRNGKTRLLIAVDYLQQGASLEVDDCLLERV